MGIILYLAIIILALIVVFIINKFDKTKTTQNIIKSIGKDI